MRRVVVRPRQLLAAAGLGYLAMAAIFLLKPRVLRSLAGQGDPIVWPNVVHALLTDLGFVALATLMALLLARSASGRDEPDAARKLAQRWGWLIVLAVWLPVTVLYSTGVVDGERYFWTRDDQMISLIYAKNWVEGQGLTWAGVRLEGYSNPLWVLWMALLYGLGVSAKLAPLALLLSNLVLGGGMLAASASVARRLGGGAYAGIATVLAVALTPFGLGLTRGGWEAIPLTLLTLLAFCRVVDERERGMPTLATAALLGLIALVRIDAAIISIVLGLAWALSTRERVRAFGYGALAALPLAASFLFRHAYYGDWLPNTVYLKTHGWPGKLHAGAVYVAKFCAQMAPVLALAAFAGWQRRHFAPWLALALSAVLLVQVASVGGDYYFNFRMLMPAVPLLFALAFCAIERLALKPALQIVAGIVMIAGTAGIFPDLLGRYAAIEEREWDDIAIAKVLAPLCRNGERVADFDAGVPYYFSGCKGIDLLGKIDRHIARGPTSPGDDTQAHNKYDYDYSLGVLRPAYVIGAVDGFPTVEQLKGYSATGTYFAERFYANKIFQQRCQPNVVPSATRRKIFRCDWSGLPPPVVPEDANPR